MMPSSVTDFLASLETTPWFSRVGEPISDLPKTQRIHTWDEWRGPEDDDVEALHLRQQALYDELMAKDDATQTLKRTWDQIHAMVFRRATATVPYDAMQDSWHAPSMAVWHAAWTAGLVGLCLASGQTIPDDLQRQWQWFLRGHWPCSYKRVYEDEEPAPLIIY